MLAPGVTDGLEPTSTVGETGTSSSGVTVHVLITPREAPPVLGSTGADTPIELILLGIVLTVSGIALLLRRAVTRPRTGAPDGPG